MATGRWPIIAGAGTGKTKTLAARVAWLLERGVPRRSASCCDLHPPRRAGDAPSRRTVHPSLVASRGHGPCVWGGTFHAVANRLLRQHGHAVGLTPDFTVLDQSDAEDLLNLVRHEMGLHSREKRFPKKARCWRFTRSASTASSRSTRSCRATSRGASVSTRR